MMAPKKIKHRKWHKRAGNSGRIATRLVKLAFGTHGLKAMSEAWVTANQIEAARRVLSRAIKKTGKVWIRIFPDKPVTVKGNTVRMGGGKGSPEKFVFAVKPGAILFEIDGVPDGEAKQTLREAAHKLPLKAKLVTRVK